MFPQFDPIWAWPWVALAAGVSLVVVVTTYRQRIAHLPPGQRKLLLALRLFTWAILTLAMFRPWMEVTEIDRHASVFVVAVRQQPQHERQGRSGRRNPPRRRCSSCWPTTQRELGHLGKEIEIKRIDFAKDIVRSRRIFARHAGRADGHRPHARRHAEAGPGKEGRRRPADLRRRPAGPAAL